MAVHNKFVKDGQDKVKIGVFVHDGVMWTVRKDIGVFTAAIRRAKIVDDLCCCVWTRG